MKFRPHDYQEYCIEYIKTHPVSALFLDMGLGKTAITLTALRDMMLDDLSVSKTLVIAPLRVARDTWPDEVRKWDHLSDLEISVIVGDAKTRTAALLHPALVYVVNRENVKWLVEYYEKNGLRWDFDCIVIDELSSFKNHQSQRFKWLRKVRPFVKRYIGLTGTPASNGLPASSATMRTTATSAVAKKATASSPKRSPATRTPYRPFPSWRKSALGQKRAAFADFAAPCRQRGEVRR